MGKSIYQHFGISKLIPDVAFEKHISRISKQYKDIDSNLCRGFDLRWAFKTTHIDRPTKIRNLMKDRYSNY